MSSKESEQNHFSYIGYEASHDVTNMDEFQRKLAETKSSRMIGDNTGYNLPHDRNYSHVAADDNDDDDHGYSYYHQQQQQHPLFTYQGFFGDSYAENVSSFPYPYKKLTLSHYEEGERNGKSYADENMENDSNSCFRPKNENFVQYSSSSNNSEYEYTSYSQPTAFNQPQFRFPQPAFQPYTSALEEISFENEKLTYKSPQDDVDHPNMADHFSQQIYHDKTQSSVFFKEVAAEPRNHFAIQGFIPCF